MSTPPRLQVSSLYRLLTPSFRPVWEYLDNMITICRYFAKGKCSNGSRCRYLHQTSAEDSFHQEDERARSRSAECGICMEPIVGKFGLLNCNCAFCLNCIQEWRAKSPESTALLCPLCRLESLEVIPADLHVTDRTRKAAIRNAYHRTSKVPCKHFKSSMPWSCLHGKHCNYAHRLRDGSPVPDEIYSVHEFEFPDLSASTNEIRNALDNVIAQTLSQDRSASAESVGRNVSLLFKERYGTDRFNEVINPRK